MKCVVCNAHIQDGGARCPVCGFYVILNLEPDDAGWTKVIREVIPAVGQPVGRQKNYTGDMVTGGPVFNQPKAVLDHLALFYKAYGNFKMIPAYGGHGGHTGNIKQRETAALRLFETLKAFNRCSVENPGDFNSLCRRLSTVYQDGYDSCRQWLVGLLYMKKSRQSVIYVKKARQKFAQAFYSGYEPAGLGLILTELFERPRNLSSRNLSSLWVQVKENTKARAAAGNALSALLMGMVCYQQKNTSEAAKWLRAAWCGGAADAGWMLGRLEKQRIRSQNEMNTVWILYRMAWRRGCPMAASDMLDVFCMGYGTVKDIQSVIVWYEHQARSGNLKAMRRLSDLNIDPKSRMYHLQKGRYWLRMVSDKGKTEDQT